MSTSGGKSSAGYNNPVFHRLLFYRYCFIIDPAKSVPDNTMHENGGAVSEIAAEILILALVVILGAIIFVMVFGVMPQIPRTSYLATEISLKEMPGYSAIAIRHQAGDSLNFTGGADLPGAAQVSILTPTGTYTAVPGPGFMAFGPGSTVYVYYTGTVYRLVSDLSGVTAQPLPASGLRLTLVDRTSGLLINAWDLLPSGTPTPTITTTATATATVTPTATATATPTNTTTPSPTATATPAPTATATATPTPTATATPAPIATTPVTTKTITVIWSPNGLGYGSESPPVKLVNSQEVRVPRGSSKTIYFVPNSGKKVLTIKLDGTTVYSGSSVGSTISYTVSNIVEDRTLTATFG